MNKKILKNVVILLILLFGIFISNTVFAAGNFSVNKSSATIKEGKTTTFTIDGSSATGKVNITSSDVTVATVSSSSVWLENSSSTITITGKKAGTATITVSGKVSDSKGEESVITKTISVTVEAEKIDNGDSNNNSGGSTGSNNGTTNNNTGSNSGTTTEQPETKSTNAYLSTLGVTPKEYDFSGFKKTNLTYSVTVPYEVDELKVLYKTAHSGAKVKVTGNSGFEVGSSNKITIKVTAEDGKTTKTYTIKVTKLAEEEEKPGNIIEDDEGLYLTSLSIEGIELSPEFSKDVYAYTATLSEINVTEVEVNAEANKENTSIEISGNTNLVVGDNTINIVLKQEGSTIQTVYQITLTKESTLVATTGEDVNFMSGLIDNIKNYVIIAIIVVVLIITVIIILIVLLRKENKRLKNEEIEEEYNVYENDENEFKSNNVEEMVKEQEVEEVTNETETKNEGRRTRRKEKGRHSK